MKTPYNSILLNSADDVATAIVELQKGDIGRFAQGEEIVEVVIAGMVPKFHKFAVRQLHKSERIRKYGEIIGEATHDIAKGDHVHDHNLVSPPRPDNRQPGDQYL